jgi:hypothetical protein
VELETHPKCYNKDAIAPLHTKLQIVINNMTLPITGTIVQITKKFHHNKYHKFKNNITTINHNKVRQIHLIKSITLFQFQQKKTIREKKPKKYPMA